MVRVVPLILVLTVAAAAQVASPAAPNLPAASPSAVSVLPNLRTTVENTRVDLASMRINRWKGKGNVKQDAAARAESIQRNLTEAMPGLMGKVQQSPQSLNAAFTLYRNLNVLYDVMNSLTESAGTFGPKDEYAALARDLQQFDEERRSLGNALETMTAQRDAEITRIQQAARAEASTPPKTIIIDDTAPKKTAKRPVRKKRVEKKPVEKKPVEPKQ